MAEEAGEYRAGADGTAGGRPGEEWASGPRVRLLRHHFGETQAEFADRLGTNQQTVSEWERGARQPRRMARRLLHFVAEQAGYYDASDGDGASGDAPAGDAAAGDGAAGDAPAGDAAAGDGAAGDADG